MFLYGGEHIQAGERVFYPELFDLEESEYHKSVYINMTVYNPLAFHAALPTDGCGKSSFTLFILFLSKLCSIISR